MSEVQGISIDGEVQQLVMAEENALLTSSINEYLQNRVVQLGMELKKTQSYAQQLEARLTDLLDRETLFTAEMRED